MRDCNYIMTIDENGSPCLHHAGLFGGGKDEREHDYYARIETGKGNGKNKWRYFYSADEYKAFLDNAKKTAGNAIQNVKDKTGISQRQALKEANQKTGLFAGRQQKKAREAYDNTLLGRAENAARGAAGKVGSSARGAAGKVGSAARGVADKVGDKLGVDERERLQSSNVFNRNMRQNAYDNTLLGKAENASKKAGKKITDAKSALEEHGGKTLDSLRGGISSLRSKASGAAEKAKDRLGFDAREALEEANQRKGLGSKRAQKNAQEAYDQTALGKAEGAARKAASSVTDAASGVRDSIRGIISGASDAVRDTAGKAGEAARGAATSTRNAVDNATGKTDKKEMDKGGREALMGLDDSIGTFIDAQNNYNKSISGKASRASEAAGDALREAQNSVMQALGKAREYLPDEQIEAITNLFRKKK